MIEIAGGVKHARCISLVDGMRRYFVGLDTVTYIRRKRAYESALSDGLRDYSGITLRKRGPLTHTHLY